MHKKIFILTMIRKFHLLSGLWLVFTPVLLWGQQAESKTEEINSILDIKLELSPGLLLAGRQEEFLDNSITFADENSRLITYRQIGFGAGLMLWPFKYSENLKFIGFDTTYLFFLEFPGSYLIISIFGGIHL